MFKKGDRVDSQFGKGTFEKYLVGGVLSQMKNGEDCLIRFDCWIKSRGYQHSYVISRYMSLIKKDTLAGRMYEKVNSIGRTLRLLKQ